MKPNFKKFSAIQKVCEVTAIYGMTNDMKTPYEGNEGMKGTLSIQNEKSLLLLYGLFNGNLFPPIS